MSTRVHCHTCLRTERWSGDTRTVVQEGGKRRPAIHPVLAAWDTLRVHTLDGRHPRGVCVCGQPLLDDGGADADHPVVDWTFPMPAGPPLTMDPRGVVHDASQPLTLGQVTDRLEAAYPRSTRERPHVVAFQLMAILPVALAVFTLWLGAATVLVFMLRAMSMPVGL
jgi:hypothetical protein